MESEYIAMSTACCDLFPLMEKLIELTCFLDLPFTVYEDEAGAVLLKNLEERRMTPRLNHYAVKYSPKILVTI